MPEQEQFNPVAKNIIAVTVSHFLLKTVSAIISIVIARYLGVMELGYYATAVSFAGLAGIITNAGLRDILIKNISTSRENIREYIGSAIFIQFTLSASVYLLMIILTNWLNYDPIVIRLIYLGGAAAFLADLIEFLFAYYYGNQRMEKIVFFRFIYFLAIISLISLIINFNKGLIEITLANFAVALTITILLLGSIFREIGFRINIRLFPLILKEALPFGLNIIYNIAYTRIGIVLLSFYAGAATIGFYDSSYKVITLLGIVPNIILTAIYPVLFKLGIKAEHDYRQTFLTALKYLSIFGFPASTFIFIYCEKISVLIYGKSFAEAGIILKTLAFIFAFQCISYPLADALTTKNRQTVRTRIIGFAFIVTLLGNLILIPIMGVLGTAFVALFTELFLLIVMLYYVKNLVFEIRFFAIFAKKILASALMGLGLYFLNINNLFIGFLCGTVVYLGVLFSLSEAGLKDLQDFYKNKKI
jgi:O-antigen/teichoic acid export membrane protein